MQESTSEQLKQKYIRPYSFSYKALYKASWQLTKGAKGALLLGDFLYTLVILIGILLRYLIAQISHPNLGFMSQIVFILIVAKPLVCGLWLIAMQRAAGNKIKGTAIFSAINGFINIEQIFIISLYLVGLALVMAIPVIVFSVIGSSFFAQLKTIQSSLSIGVITLYFCGLIYLMVIYSLALPLIASQRISGL